MKPRDLDRLTTIARSYILICIYMSSMETRLLADIDLTGTGYCASFNFRRTTRAVTKLFDLALEGAGIRSTQFTILVGIAKTQPVSMGSLADVLALDPTTLTRSLRPLQQDGLLEISDRAAMRQRFITLTHKGERTLAKAVPKWRKVQKHFVNAVGERYWSEFRGELERLASVTVGLERPLRIT
jgi:DNA-binding MarR family transcriptional regulator